MPRCASPVPGSRREHSAAERGDLTERANVGRHRDSARMRRRDVMNRRAVWAGILHRESAFRRVFFRLLTPADEKARPYSFDAHPAPRVSTRGVMSGLWVRRASDLSRSEARPPGSPLGSGRAGHTRSEGGRCVQRPTQECVAGVDLRERRRSVRERADGSFRRRCLGQDAARRSRRNVGT
jgi:hypothetical protein